MHNLVEKLEEEDQKYIAFDKIRLKKVFQSWRHIKNGLFYPKLTK